MGCQINHPMSENFNPRTFGAAARLTDKKTNFHHFYALFALEHHCLTALALSSLCILLIQTKNCKNGRCKYILVTEPYCFAYCIMGVKFVIESNPNSIVYNEHGCLQRVCAENFQLGSNINSALHSE